LKGRPVQSRLEQIFDEDADSVVGRPLDWGRLAGSRVVVTGAAGFLGGGLVRALLALNKAEKLSAPVHVVAMVRNAGAARERFARLASPHLELIQWDLNTIGVPDIGRAQYVLHAASQASPRFYGTDPVGTLLPNAVGTAALLEALRQSADPRGFLFVSSSEIYGSVKSDAVLAENDYGVVDPTSVRACYAESKRIGETMCVSWHHQYGIPALIVRPFHTYGPGLLPEDGRVFADFAFNIIRGENIIMKSDGSARRAFCYGSDAVAGFFTVLLKGIPGQAYNVANPGAELSVAELANLLVNLLPERGLRIERHSNPGQYMQSTYSRLIPDVSKLESLGWRAVVGPADGFRRMIAAYQ
jgi:UDP-glucuronate decarboxylase